MHREESPRARPADAENRGMNAWIHCKRFDSPNVTEAAGLTQWGSSWRRERVPVNSKELWKSVEKFEAPFSENTLTRRLPSARLSLTPTTEGQDGEINSPLQEQMDGRGIEIR